MTDKSKKVVLKVGLDVTGAKKATAELAKDISKSTRELKSIGKALKLDPDNAELLRQKAHVLQSLLTKTQEKSVKLKEALANLKSAGIDETSEEFRKLQREIIANDAQATKLRSTIASMNDVKLTVAEQFEQAGDKIQVFAKKTKHISMAAAGAAAGIFALAKKSGTVADDLNTLSKVTGISTDELQRMAFASDLVDVKVEDVARALSKLAKNACEAEKGSKTATEAFGKLGISWKNNNGKFKQGKELFDEVIDALHNIKDETQRNSLAMDLMGKSAMALNPLILDGAAAFREAAKSAKGILSQEEIDKANAFNDSLDLIKAQAKQTGLQLGAMFADDFKESAHAAQVTLSNIADKAKYLSPAMRKGVAGTVVALSTLNPVLNTVGSSLKNVSEISKATKKTFGLLSKGGKWAINVGKNIPGLIGKLKNLKLTSGTAHKALQLFSTAGNFFSGLSGILPVITAKLATTGLAAKGMWMAVTGPVGLTVAAIAGVSAAIAILYNKCKWFRDGVHALLNGVARFIKGIANGIANIFNGIKNTVARIFGKTKELEPNDGNHGGGNHGEGVPHLSIGTDYVQKSGLAVIHQGEAVVTRESNSKFDRIADLLGKMPTGVSKAEIVINLDGQTIARKVHSFVSEYQAKDLRKAEA